MRSCRVMLGPKDVAKAASTAPVVSPVVLRSLYRRLFREVSKLEENPLAKTLFPLTTDLQAVVGIPRPLYIPGTKNYTEVLREVFRDGGKPPNVKLAFDTLNRLRSHGENVKSLLPAVHREREALVRSLAAETPKHAPLFRAEVVPMKRESAPRFVPATAGEPSKLLLRDRTCVELEPGTVLLAHPLSSTHVDRRVMIITERTPVMTSGVVLDLQFVFPISRGNPMFPEAFWGHEIYDGGFTQINLTMPPTAQVVVLHTLAPPSEAEEAEEPPVSTAAPAAAQDYVSSWLKWGGGSGTAADRSAGTEDGEKPRKRGVTTRLQRQHELLCEPIIKGTTLANGEKEPTLYVSKVESLPYLAKLAAGKPRSSLRVYWGSMRWMTSHIETEVSNGHWFPVKVSPSFFRSYELSPEENLKDYLRRRSGSSSGGGGRPFAGAPCFPAADELAAAERLREKRFGANISLPQVFPRLGALRRREYLWDEILYALGGEYVSLVGGVNPFMLSGQNRGAAHSIARHFTTLPFSPLVADGDDTGDDSKDSNGVGDPVAPAEETEAAAAAAAAGDAASQDDPQRESPPHGDKDRD